MQAPVLGEYASPSRLLYPILFPEISSILLSKGLELSEKGSLICIHHPMSHLFENFLFISLSSIYFSEFLNRFSLTFLTDFIHRSKIKRINRFIMKETQEKTYQEMFIKP